MTRLAYFILGTLALVLGVIGAFIPLLPTVPFLLLAAFCFGRSHPPFERWLTDHPRFGQHIRRWRERRAISRGAKRTALTMLAASAIAGLLLLAAPWSILPLLAALAAGSWIATRPDS